MKPFQLVEHLNDPKQNTGLLIQQAWASDSDEFFVGLSLATNPSLDFKVRNVPLIEDEDDNYPGSLTFNDFHDLALKLAYDELNEDEVKKALEDAAMIANAKEWNIWYRRILLKSLPKYLPMKAIQKELIRLTTE